MALESLTLGVEGKASLWKALKAAASQYPPLEATNLDALIAPRRSTTRSNPSGHAAGKHALRADG
jgi:hypothetical protein